MSSESKAKVLLVGYGYWGKKLAKTLHKLGVLAAVWDQNSEAREAALKDFPGELSLGVHMESSTWKTCRELTHAVIATPPETHASLASDTLKAGLHTFVEKPLATTREHALVLEDLARKVGRHLNTGHIYLHNPGLFALARDIGRPFAGRVRIDIQLLNVGGPPSQSTRDLMWAGMPHAISVVLYLTGQRPSWIQQTSHDIGRYRNWLGTYLNGTEVHVTVADYAGVRRRLVRVEDSIVICGFDADRPYQHDYINKITGQVTREPEWVAPDLPDPLTIEMKAFLQGEPDQVLASDVVAVIEEAIWMWKQNQQKP